MTQVTVDSTHVGQEVATGPGVLNGIVMVTASNPGEFRSYFTLARGQSEDVIFNFDPTTSHVGAGSVLASGAGILFDTLVLVNAPVGSSFELDFASPPTLTSISPDTAACGDPEFTLSCIGTDFGPSATMNFAGHDEPTTLVSDTEVTTIVKPSLWANPDVVPVYLHIGEAKTETLDFTFTEPAQ
jgi:hypothetical protein